MQCADRLSWFFCPHFFQLFLLRLPRCSFSPPLLLATKWQLELVCIPSFLQLTPRSGRVIHSSLHLTFLFSNRSAFLWHVCLKCRKSGKERQNKIAISIALPFSSILQFFWSNPFSPSFLSLDASTSSEEAFLLSDVQKREIRIEFFMLRKGKKKEKKRGCKGAAASRAPADSAGAHTLSPQQWAVLQFGAFESVARGHAWRRRRRHRLRILMPPSFVAKTSRIHRWPRRSNLFPSRFTTQSLYSFCSPSPIQRIAI